LSADLPPGTHLEAEHGGALAWGEHYPAPGRDHRDAKNGSAPGYVAVPDEEEE
jgi:hypothetical protein